MIQLIVLLPVALEIHVKTPTIVKNLDPPGAHAIVIDANTFAQLFHRCIYSLMLFQLFLYSGRQRNGHLSTALCKTDAVILVGVVKQNLKEGLTEPVRVVTPCHGICQYHYSRLRLRQQIDPAEEGRQATLTVQGQPGSLIPLPTVGIRSTYIAFSPTSLERPDK